MSILTSMPANDVEYPTKHKYGNRTAFCVICHYNYIHKFQRIYGPPQCSFTCSQSTSTHATATKLVVWCLFLGKWSVFKGALVVCKISAGLPDIDLG